MQFFANTQGIWYEDNDTDCVVEPAQHASCLGMQTVATEVWERVCTVHFLSGVEFGWIT